MYVCLHPFQITCFPVSSMRMIEHTREIKTTCFPVSLVRMIEHTRDIKTIWFQVSLVRMRLIMGKKFIKEKKKR